jgi:hypothetical protein
MVNCLILDLLPMNISLMLAERIGRIVKAGQQKVFKTK